MANFLEERNERIAKYRAMATIDVDVSHTMEHSESRFERYAKTLKIGQYVFEWSNGSYSLWKRVDGRKHEGSVLTCEARGGC